jgi:hypothetical protein
MAIDRSVFLEIVKDAYSAYYTILPVEEGEEELPLTFRAEYKVQDEQFFFVKSATIWHNEKNEYCFVFSAPGFDAALVKACIDFSLEEMLPKVKPNKTHQYTNCKVILIADSLGADAVKTVQKSKFSRSYGPLSTHGYTELLAAAVDLEKQKTYTNRMGNSLETFFSKLFALRSEDTQGNGK